MARTQQRNSQRGQLRIIGGRWRGRKLSFTAQEGLRPTTDRIRETLFNWLAPHIHGARCADLFAGSGALGLEALSRGAAACDFVDNSNAVTAQIQDQLKTLEAELLGQCVTSNAENFLQGATQPYDVVFLDPPFAEAVTTSICAALDTESLLNQDAHVYIETSAAEPPPEVPSTWKLYRDKQAGGVAFRLYLKA